MPEPNAIEIALRLRDEATKGMQQFAATTQAVTRQATALVPATQAAGTGLENVSRSAVSASRQISAGAQSARFLAVTVANELSPALGQGAARLTSLASVAAFSGSVMGGALVIGIGAAVAALGSWIAATRKAREEQEKLNELVAEGAVGPIQQQINALNKRIKAQEEVVRATKDEIVFMGEFAEAISKREVEEERLGALLKERTDLTDKLAAANAVLAARLAGEHQLALIGLTKQWVELQTAETGALVLQGRFVDEGKRLAGVKITGIQEVLKLRLQEIETEKQLAIEEAKRTGNLQAIEKAEEIARGKRINAEQEAANKIRAIRAELTRDIERLEQEATKKAEEQAERDTETLAARLRRERAEFLEHARTISEIGVTAGAQFSAGMMAGVLELQEAMGTLGQNVRGIVVGSGQAWARGLDDAFFSVVTGQTKKLSEVFRNMGAQILRELTGMFARLATGGIARQLEQAFGLAPGRLTGFSPAALGAVIPGGPGIPGPQTAGQVAAGFGFGTPIPSPFLPTAFAPGTAAELEARGLGGLLADGGGAAGGLTFLGGLGAALSVLGGAAAIFSTSQMTSPLLGAITGGLGGLSAAAGLSMLLGLGLSPIGLGVGFAFGAITGGFLASSARRRAERQLAFQRAVSDTVSRIEREAERFSPEQIDELIAFLRDGQAPSDPAVVGLADAVRNLTGLQGTPPGGVLPPGLAPIGVPTDVLAGQRFRGLIGDEAFDSLINTLLGLKERAEGAGGFLIEEAFAPGITRLEALARLGPRQRAAAIAALQRGALVSLINAAGPEELELILNRLREFAELVGLPILPQARFVEVLG